MHAAPQPAMDDARRLVALDHLEELGTSVRLECLPRVVREPRGIARPRRLIDLDHNPRNLVTTSDLPEPTARVPVRASVSTEVRADLPSHELRLRQCLPRVPGIPKRGNETNANERRPRWLAKHSTARPSAAAKRSERTMDGNFGIGRFGGVEVRINWSLLAVFALIVWSLTDGVFPSQNPGLSDGTYLAMAIVTALLFFASILLHELGHSLEARREGIEVDSITLWLFGGVSEVRLIPSRTTSERWTAKSCRARTRRSAARRPVPARGFVLG